MQASRKRRGRGGIVKDHAMIEGDASWKTCGEEGAAEHELIGFQGGIRCFETRIALDLQTTHDIQNGNQTDLSNPGYVHAALRIKFPFVMRCTFWLERWTGQITVLLITARELLSAQ